LKFLLSFKILSLPDGVAVNLTGVTPGQMILRLQFLTQSQELCFASLGKPQSPLQLQTFTTAFYIMSYNNEKPQPSHNYTTEVCYELFKGFSEVLLKK
jgi:hypothetical protein